MNTSKISIIGVLGEGYAIGLKNLPSLLGACILWVLTCWIPYLNVGTTIALTSIPIELSKGKVISPLFIFDAKYRRYMGEFFTLQGMMGMAIIPALLFMVIPGIIIALGWSLAVLILLDKGVSPGEAMIRSNAATYGYKKTIFGVSFVLGAVYGIVSSILMSIADNFFIVFLVVILGVVFLAFGLGCQAVIYRNLVTDEPKNNSDSLSTD